MMKKKKRKDIYVYKMCMCVYGNRGRNILMSDDNKTPRTEYNVQVL